LEDEDFNVGGSVQESEGGGEVTDEAMGFGVFVGRGVEFDEAERVEELDFEGGEFDEGVDGFGELGLERVFY